MFYSPLQPFGRFFSSAVNKQCLRHKDIGVFGFVFCPSVNLIGVLTTFVIVINFFFKHSILFSSVLALNFNVLTFFFRSFFLDSASATFNGLMEMHNDVMQLLFLILGLVIWIGFYLIANFFLQNIFLNLQLFKSNFFILVVFFLTLISIFFFFFFLNLFEDRFNVFFYGEAPFFLYSFFFYSTHIAFIFTLFLLSYSSYIIYNSSRIPLIFDFLFCLVEDSILFAHFNYKLHFSTFGLIFKNKYRFYRLPNNVIFALFLEIYWTIFPSLVLLAISVASFTVLYGLDDNSYLQDQTFNQDTVHVKIFGRQWYWSYELAYCVAIIGQLQPSVAITDEADIQILQSSYKDQVGQQLADIESSENETEQTWQAVLDLVSRVELGQQLADIESSENETRQERQAILDLFFNTELDQSWLMDLAVQQLADIESSENETRQERQAILDLLSNTDSGQPWLADQVGQQLANIGSLENEKAQEWQAILDLFSNTELGQPWVLDRVGQQLADIESSENEKAQETRQKFVQVGFGISDWIQFNLLTQQKVCNVKEIVVTSHESYMVLTADISSPANNQHLSCFHLEFQPQNLYMLKYRLLETDTALRVASRILIRLFVTSSDVIHSWAVPSFGIKIDACPGRLNQGWLFVDRGGIFYGQCSEICGINHGFMPIVIRCQ